MFDNFGGYFHWMLTWSVVFVPHYAILDLILSFAPFWHNAFLGLHTVDSNQQETAQSKKLAFSYLHLPFTLSKFNLVAIDSIKEVRVGWNSELLRITETAVTPEINVKFSNNN